MGWKGLKEQTPAPAPSNDGVRESSIDILSRLHFAPAGSRPKAGPDVTPIERSDARKGVIIA